MKEIISRMDAMERHTTNEIRIVYWVVGIIGTIMSVLLAIIALKK